MAGLFPFMVPAEDAVTTYRYLRLAYTTLSGTFMEGSDIQWSDDGGTTKYPASIGNMTSNVLPSPLVASSSTIIGAGYEAWRGFNGNTGDYVACSDSSGHVTIDLGAGNEIAPNYLYWNKGHPSNHYPVDFTLEGSNTGAFSGEETVFKTVTGQGIGPWTHTW